MKDPKDNKKFELPPLESLLSAEYIWTPYGRICSKMEVLCVYCEKKETIIVPEEIIKSVDSEDLTGSAFAEYFAEKKGWIIKPVQRSGGKIGLFMLCPVCIEERFKKFE